MNKIYILLAVLALSYGQVRANEKVSISSPDAKVKVELTSSDSGQTFYQVLYDGKEFLQPSPLGVKADIGDFSEGLSITGHSIDTIHESYKLDRIKTSCVDYRANRLLVSLSNVKNEVIQVEFRVSNNDIAFRYLLPKQGEPASVRVESETTGFRFPEGTTTFLTPQSDAMIGWKRSKPSYEEVYKTDASMVEKSQYGHGYTFPCLFRIGDDGWVLLSETGVDSHYCASHLSDRTNGVYTVAFPMKEENNGNGTVAPAFSLPGATPWRTITLGETLKPIVETTIPWSVVEPLYETRYSYRMGRSTWSWILWQDWSINYDDQVKYVDLASAMGYEYVLIDAGWDKNIGYDRMAELVKYARGKGVDVFLWYSSSGYWNDIVQTPVNKMDNSIVRKREMDWMQNLGVKGIKVDFFGGDKQETMRLYEDILSDADDHGLMVIFHGCTLPRGWERMYPNYVGSEAVLASENMIFGQKFCDSEAINACLHPFIRNTVGSMEYGGVFLNKNMSRNNKEGSRRVTTDVFQLAVAVLFQNPIQNFALAPNNLTDAPELCLQFMKHVPTIWDETRFIDGYPGKYIVLARRRGDKWYVAAVNAQKEPLKLKFRSDILAGGIVSKYYDGKDLSPKMEKVEIDKKGDVSVEITSGGAVVWVR